MSDFHLQVTAPAQEQIYDNELVFYWTPLDAESSFKTKYGPCLGSLGPVMSANVDFVRIAATVLAADRSTLRRGGGSNWNCRDIGLSIPVYHPDRWRAASDNLKTLLGLLTGDRWRLDFIETPHLDEEITQVEVAPERVVLVSGGADSAVGALRSIQSVGAGGHVLVSHVGASILATPQQDVVARAVQHAPGIPQRHLQIIFNRKADKIDGKRFPNEPSTRSRSLLFIALGLAVASCHGVPLWIPENGFASLNPPLTPERRGALSTRTTHPAFIEGLIKILQDVGVHADISNPFDRMTKGEIFAQAADMIGRGESSKFLSRTHSCGHTDQRYLSISPLTQCGVCFGCILRKASFHASNIQDSTNYIQKGMGAQIDNWLKSKSAESSVRHFIQKGERDIRVAVASMGLPSSFLASDASELCVRGLRELQRLYQ